ncbi:MAG: RidA family protein [Melioribacteraceae bacterium]|nr:RidA family protein [Melioribacteraceae bacterium]
MSLRKNISTGTEWEEKAGYSRAVVIGNMIEVSGTVAADENGKVVSKNNPYEQTKFILSKIETTLIKAGASIKDVVRTRMFVTDINNWQEVSNAHGEVFRNIKPASSLLEVSRLIDKDFLVEIEVTAVK